MNDDNSNKSNNRGYKKPYNKRNKYNNQKNKDNSNKTNNNKNQNDNKQGNNQNSSQNNNGNKKKRFNKNKKYFKKRNFQKKRNTNGQRYSQKKENIIYEDCPICNEKIKEPLYSIKDKVSGKNAHFECIQDQILKNENLKSDEKLYYLGGGSFGVVSEKRFRGRTKFTINKKIQYQTKK